MLTPPLKPKSDVNNAITNMSVETFFPETCLFNVSFNVNSAVSWHKPVITTHPKRGVVSSKVTLLFYVCPRASAVFIWNITHV